jgi:SAM-dependent methyltransferase
VPSIAENRAIFERYDWPEGGDEWSRQWGSSRMFFYGTVMPRIAAFVPCGHLLEIAPGHGRCTQFLLGLCRQLTAVDVAERCVRACRERFAAASHARFVEGDGRSLPFLDDESVDFGFSFDSLVHADQEAMSGYLHELRRTLKPGAHALVHHSNLGEYIDPATGEPTVPNPEFRDSTVSADSARDWAAEAGLACLAQELLNWHSPHYTDCVSLLRRDDRPVETVVSRHPDLSAEYDHLRRVQALFDR